MFVRLIVDFDYLGAFRETGKPKEKLGRCLIHHHSIRVLSGLLCQRMLLEAGKEIDICVLS